MEQDQKPPTAPQLQIEPPKTAQPEIIIGIGSKIAISGYLYEVVKGFGNCFTMRYKGPHNKGDVPKPTILKKRHTFSVGNNHITVINRSGALYTVRVRQKKLSDKGKRRIYD